MGRQGREDAAAPAAAHARARDRSLDHPQRENAPDPALELFGGYGVTGWYGHRNAYLFHDAGAGGLETTVLGTHLSGHLARFYDTRELYGEEGLAPHLRRYVEERDPRRIAINQSRTISMADGSRPS